MRKIKNYVSLEPVYIYTQVFRKSYKKIDIKRQVSL